VFALNSEIVWFDFHLSEAQRVVVTSPMIPLHTVSVGRVIASQIETVQVGMVTFVVPPSTFEFLGTMEIGRVVVLVSSAKLASKMIAERVTFKQHTNTDTTRQLFAILAQAPTSYQQSVDLHPAYPLSMRRKHSLEQLTVHVGLQ